MIKNVGIETIPGILIGHATDSFAATGCTVIIAPQGASCGVDVRGGAPATRETDLLKPENTVDKVHAVVLSGGSAFGLAAGSGVADELESHGIGFDVGVTAVPIVCQASLFDLTVGDSLVRPTVEFGVHAVKDAFARKLMPPLQGNVGAGTGASVGKICGPARSMKSGLGISCLANGPLTVGALVALNALGDIRDPQTGKTLAGLRASEDSHELQSSLEVLLSSSDKDVMPLTRTNTTIACIVTNANLTKAHATRVSQMAHDAYAHCICPTHTTNDGDTIFTLATGEVEAPLDAIGALAVKALEEAIVNAITSARSSHGLLAHCDL